MMKPKILVTSAAGKTGMQTALQLLAMNFPVRAFVRTRDRRAERLKQAGAEIHVGNQYSIRDMRAAMQGVQRAYHCAPAAANGLHFGTVFTVAAREARIEHVVTLSQWLSDPDHPSLATREVWLNDQIAGLLPDATVTVNNVGWFADNYFLVLEAMAQLGMMPMPLGTGLNAPPSNEDIAAVSVGALVDPARHAGKTYRPTGPKLLDPHEIAGAVGQALGRKVVFRDISDTLFLKALAAQKRPEYMVTQLLYYVEDYRRNTFGLNAPTQAVEDVAGRAPESFETIARRYVAERPEAVRSLGNRLAALRNFAKILLTAKPDPLAIEMRRDHVLLAEPVRSDESSAWRRRHDPGAGYLPDRPREHACAAVE